MRFGVWYLQNEKQSSSIQTFHGGIMQAFCNHMSNSGSCYHKTSRNWTYPSWNWDFAYSWIRCFPGVGHWSTARKISKYSLFCCPIFVRRPLITCSSTGLVSSFCQVSFLEVTQLTDTSEKPASSIVWLLGSENSKTGANSSASFSGLMDFNSSLVVN